MKLSDSDTADFFELETSLHRKVSLRQPFREGAPIAWFQQ
jgi:hypothetical protein